MPAVHHKLLLEDALQDSPQVGLRLFSHVCVPSCLIKGVTSAEVSLAQTVSSTRCSLFPLVDDSSQLTHCYKNCNPPVSSSCTFKSFLQHVTVMWIFFVSPLYLQSYRPSQGFHLSPRDDLSGVHPDLCQSQPYSSTRLGVLQSFYFLMP